MSEIVKKRYYQITFRAESPLAIGSGENRLSDKDIIRDTAGVPYIPATAIAGVSREYVMKQGIVKEQIKNCFGNVETGRGSARESHLVFYDARLKTQRDYHTSVRDSVKLDAFKTAVDGAKFDMEVLEQGVELETFLEWNGRKEDNDDQILDCIVQMFLNGEAIFGGKGTRGYGKISKATVRKKEFQLENNSDVDAWLSFDLFATDAFADADSIENDKTEQRTAEKKKTEKKHTLVLSLCQKGGISIRRYTTKVREKDTDVQPDFEQLTAHTMDGIYPVVPGTSWAGAFRHAMRKLGLSKDEEKALFGHVGEKENIRKKSLIRFGESVLKNAHEKILSRNAIDRFSGGTKDGALFTEKTWYGGKTELEIGFFDSQHITENHKKLLAAAIADLHNGFLAVGGETSVGRGLFAIETINDEKVSGAEQVYELALRHIGEVTRK